MQLDMTRRNGTSGWGPRRGWRAVAVCLALLIVLAPSVHAFAMASHAFARALVETPDHTASQMAHQHGDESLAIDNGGSDCSANHSVDLCMAVCCAAIPSQFPACTDRPLPRATGFLLTIPSSASGITSHPPPEAIA